MFIQISQLESDITNILTKYYPLSAKEIIQKIEKIKRTKYSMAGIQKGLAELLENGILHKHSKYYQLQTDQLLKEKQKIQSVLDRYTKAETYHQFQKVETFYYFETLSELDFFWNATAEKWFNFYPEKKYTYIQKQAFPWFTILHLDEERRIIKKICDHTKKFITICIDNLITRRLGSLYGEFSNSRLRLLKKIPDINHSFAIFGDHVIETFYPITTTKVLEKLCHSHSNGILFDAIKELSKPGSYKLQIYKDKKKAKKYKNLVRTWYSDFTRSF